ncbi:hypothetical protein [Treponema porcinum]|uniref:Uncharacterized protein n=2 Tax=Treponema TaxID=157 RepID=A0A1T4JKF0_TREPO|nr:hypothetical protein [Treponema porcinum]SJZ30608.1 hypothetical protein SAMN02745149_00498 [Treponema porcinum]
MENQKAFIATTNYIRKVKLPFGVGVITSFSEEDAMNLTIRRRHLETRNEWFDIEIPDRSTFLNLDSLLEENPQECLDSLFSTKALSFLFYDEGQKLFKQLPQIIESKTSVEEEKNTLAQEELKKFYDSKAYELKKLMSTYSLIQFITEKAKRNDMAITSSFLSMIGINGVIYSEDNNERALIFDAKNKILLKGVNSQILENSKFTEESIK